MPRERRQQPEHGGQDDQDKEEDQDKLDDQDKEDDQDEEDGHDDFDDDDHEGDIHQSVSGAKMNVPMPEPQMAMPANNFINAY